jgi:pyruvate-formate lyase-activating enzyme
MSEAPSLPSTVALELSSACSLTCSYCDKRNWPTFTGARATPFLDLKLFRRLVDELAEHPSTAVTLSYEGESLHHPEIADALQYLREKAIRPWITTTLAGTTELLLANLLQVCSTISVSLGLSEADFARSRGPAEAYSETVAKVARLLDLRRRAGGGAEIAVNATIRAGVGFDAPEVIEFINRWHPVVDEIQLWLEMGFADDVRYLHRAGIERHLSRRRVCMQPFRYVAVLSDGSLSPCCQTSRVRFTSIRADAGLAAAVQHPEYQAFLEMHRQRNLAGTPCMRCEAWLDDWLGDETISVGPKHTAILEGYTARIPFSSAAT